MTFSMNTDILTMQSMLINVV